MSESPIYLGPDEQVVSFGMRQAGIAWPLPVDAKLEQLLALAEGAGERTSRRELAAAIVALSDLDETTVGALLRRYRLSRVQDLGLPRSDENVVAFKRHGPGPRARSQ